MLFETCAFAGQTGYYAGVSTGVLLEGRSSLKDQNGESADLTYETLGIPLNASFGYQFANGLRIEEELFYKRAAADTFTYLDTSGKVGSKMWSMGAMTNLYYHWYHDSPEMNGDWFSPFVVLGGGVATVHLSEASLSGINLWNSGYDTSFAYQLGLGNSTEIYKNIIFDVSYRYFRTLDLTIDNVKTSFQNHNILLGIRYMF
jgi:opacity protein-like surface antigen